MDIARAATGVANAVGGPLVRGIGTGMNYANKRINYGIDAYKKRQAEKLAQKNIITQTNNPIQGENIPSDTQLQTTPVDNTPIYSTPIDSTPVDNTPVANPNTPIGVIEPRISKIIRPMIDGILLNTASKESLANQLSKQAVIARQMGDSVKATQLENDAKLAQQNLQKEQNTVHRIQVNTVLYSFQPTNTNKNGVYYENFHVELNSFTEAQPKSQANRFNFLIRKTQIPDDPYNYNFNDVSFTNVSHYKITDHLSKLDLTSITNDPTKALNYDKFSTGWTTMNNISNIESDELNTLLINFAIYIKNKNVYLDIPKVVFGQPTTATGKKLQPINKNTNETDIFIHFGAVDENLKNNILQQLDENYKAEEVTPAPNPGAGDIANPPAKSGQEPVAPSEKPFFTWPFVGGNFVSYLLKPKRTRRRTLKKLSKKMSKKNYKKVSKKSRKSRK